jgi:glycosyltransferase involved in cell wall biosynthesis
MVTAAAQVPFFSVVVPVYNEEGNLPELHRRLVATLEGTGRSFEIVFVDDGSRDGSYATMERLFQTDGRGFRATSATTWPSRPGSTRRGAKPSCSWIRTWRIDRR